ncbi:uncharacterized protein LOC131624032 [Vicia villosa]|uniref:uncharacterized protein LOC131624032 n=1 Tax=Vicia villosa TaxID=3911 RepID=UPI00273A8451|nr:uncharacterized protein LOC131624032 [Vicia villosa]
MAFLARGAASLTRITATASKSPIQLVHRRGLAGAADPHATPRVDIWKDPLSPSKWKEEHFVIASLTGWGVLIYGGCKLFSGGKKEEKLPEAAGRYGNSYVRKRHKRKERENDNC